MSETCLLDDEHDGDDDEDGRDDDSDSQAGSMTEYEYYRLLDNRT